MADSKIDKALQQLLKLGVETKKLWTNAKPTSNFNAQTVTLAGGTKYDSILVEFLPGTGDYSDTNGTLVPLPALKNHKNYLNYIAKTEALAAGSVAEIRSRAVTFTGKAAVFDVAYGFSISSTSRSERADYVIPLNIFGLKFIGGGYSKLKHIISIIKHLFSCKRGGVLLWQ